MIEFINFPPTKKGDILFSKSGREAILRETIKANSTGANRARTESDQKLFAYGEAVAHTIFGCLEVYDKDTAVDIYKVLIREATDMAGEPNHGFHAGFDEGWLDATREIRWGISQ